MTSEAERLERAGNYVLGLMDDDERERAERDLETDDAFRNAVIQLAERMHVFDRGLPSGKVPREMWRTIAERIADMPQMRPGPALSIASSTPGPATRARGIGLQSFGGWRGGLIAASLMIACGLGYVAGIGTRPSEKPVVIVVLNTDQQIPGAIFEAFADNTVRIVPLVDFEVPADRTLQAWTLYDPAVGPVSLGIFPRAEEVRLHRDGMPAPTDDQLYEITLEPANGSPTGKPTGPILVKGFAKRPAGA